ncbi:hypothetical protein E2C01_099528 [Portunus trituberculatus]|uniref:Uncharacterized protein n=1 Tax=Portunus trituberculatus TaxID=210409 RepID=A0A5B7K0K1_PORTR|nr:hypothetical protein [Portunus trituberculatus]
MLMISLSRCFYRVCTATTTSTTTIPPPVPPFTTALFHSALPLHGPQSPHSTSRWSKGLGVTAMLRRTAPLLP